MGDAERRKQGFAIGYLMGLSGMPVATALGPSNDPLYLYGGVALPPLPAGWDRAEYPYGVIVRKETHEYYFCAYREISYYEQSILGTKKLKYFGTKTDGTAQVFMARAGETAWILQEETKWNFMVEKTGTLTIAIWTHGFDLMYADDTLYVAASTPGRITDWDSLKGKYFYNHVVLPEFHDVDGWGHHDLCAMKHETEDVYIMYDGIWVGYYIDPLTKEVFLKPDNINTVYVYTCPTGGNVWTRADDDSSYIGETRYIEKYNWHVYYLGKQENLVWAEEDVYNFDGSVVFYGSEKIPVPVHEPPAEGADADNKAVMLGCRLGYIIRSQMGKGRIEIPDGVLISSDGYILTDCNGVYLIAKEDA